VPIIASLFVSVSVSVPMSVSVSVSMSVSEPVFVSPRKPRPVRTKYVTSHGVELNS